MNRENFLEKARKIHGNRYEYLDIPDEFDPKITTIRVVCPIHGEFLQNARSHYRGSGLNDKRKGFIKLCDLVVNGKINKVVIEHKDRLTRFNFEIIKKLAKGFNVDIEVIDIELNKTFEEELASDIVSLMASFSARLYGKRSSRNRK